MSYLAFLCGREHRFREICWILGQSVWQPVAPCGNELRWSRSPIEEDKMIRFKHPGTQILDSSCLGAWRVGFVDSSCLATWACWTDGLFWPLLRGVGVGKGLDVVGKEVESNTLDALERSADDGKRF